MVQQRVYFGKLSRDCRERDLETLAKEFGRIGEVRLLQGFAFIEYDDRRDAEDAVKELDGSRFMGERIIVELAKSRGRDDDRRDSRRDDGPPRSFVRKDGLRVTVLGLPNRTSWQDLKDLMRKAGEVQYTNVSDSTGDGVVEFIDQEGKDKALEMFSGYDYQGSTITMRDDAPRNNDSVQKKERSRSPVRERSPRRERSPAPKPRSRERSPRRDRSPPRERSRERKERSPVAKRDDSRSPRRRE